jgi:GNAT superfamily N-acetyltransferase
VVRPAGPEEGPQVTHPLSQLGYDVDVTAVETAISQGDDVLVAELDKEMVGLLTFGSRYQLHRNGKVTTIDALVVDESRRSRGIGAAPVQHLVAMAKWEGWESIELHSQVSRVAARRFYEREGFEVTSNFFRKTL